MSTPLDTTATTLRLLSAINEAVIAHEDENTTLTGALRDVADAVKAFTDHVLDTNALHIVDVLKATIEANAAAEAYLKRLESSGHAFVAIDLYLLHTANTLVSTVMNHDELIGA